MVKMLKILSAILFSTIIVSGLYIYLQENAVVEMLARKYLTAVALNNADPNYPRPMFIEHIKNNRPWNDSSNQLNDKLFQTLKNEYAQKGVEVLHRNQAVIINSGISKKGAVFSGNNNIDKWNYGEILRFGPIKWIDPFTLHIDVSSYAGPGSISSYTLIMVFRDWKWSESDAINFIIS